MKDFKEITTNTYNTQADKIAARFAKFFPTYRKPVVDKFLCYLPWPGWWKVSLSEDGVFKALDIGCGSGDAAVYIEDRLIKTFGKARVIGVDISTGMLDAAKEKGVVVAQMDIEHLGVKNESFDACWAMNSLLHLPKQRIPAVLQQMANLLKPSGTVFISIKRGEGERFVETPLAKRFYAFWEKDEFRKLVEEHFTVLDIDETSREDNHFLNFYLRKS
jgi:SAM-dependent methyltransferase